MTNKMITCVNCFLSSTVSKRTCQPMPPSDAGKLMSFAGFNNNLLDTVYYTFAHLQTTTVYINLFIN